MKTKLVASTKFIDQQNPNQELTIYVTLLYKSLNKIYNNLQKVNVPFVFLNAVIYLKTLQYVTEKSVKKVITLGRLFIKNNTNVGLLKEAVYFYSHYNRFFTDFFRSHCIFEINKSLPGLCYVVICKSQHCRQSKVH